MKLESVKVFVVGNPPPSFGGRYFIFLKLRTTNGIEGVGEVYSATFGPHVVAKMIEDVFQRRFLGEDPGQDRNPVAARARLRLFAAPGPDADGRDERPGNGVLGHSRQGLGQAGLCAARRPGARKAAHLHLHLS